MFGSVAILQTLGVNYELQWTLRHYNIVIGVSTCRLQNGQGQAGILNGLARGTKVTRGTKVARGTKALLWSDGDSLVNLGAR
jgi:hypothetical protein